MAGTFIFFLDHFRLYSTFCASHCQAQEVLRELRILITNDFIMTHGSESQGQKEAAYATLQNIIHIALL